MREPTVGVTAGIALPPVNPEDWSDHGSGLGPLDGIEDWGLSWGKFYLMIERTGGGGGFHWAVKEKRKRRWPAAANGATETLEEAGTQVAAWCMEYLR